MGEAILLNHNRIQDLYYYDNYTTIGATVTLKGAAYKNAGYFGTVPSSQLYTGTQLASAVGLTSGTVQNDDSNWLKFYIDGKIIFTPMKTFRYKLPWDQLNAANIVFGNRTVTKNGVTFKVRLFSTSLTNPANDSLPSKGVLGSEWNRLIPPISKQASDSSWDVPDMVDLDTPNWNIGFTEEDLNLRNTSATGSLTWCQETASTDGTLRMQRGAGGASNATANLSSSTAGNAYAWRPVLEVVPN